MTALTILAIALSIGAIVVCIWAETLHDEENRAIFELIKEHNEIMRHTTNCMGLLEQRIKILEQEVKKGENNDKT